MHDVIHIPGHILSLGFLFWHLWTTHPPRASVNICAQICTKLNHVLCRKVFSLTKPKGKIYKTKSLGHYITSRAKKKCDSFYWVTCFQKEKSIPIFPSAEFIVATEMAFFYGDILISNCIRRYLICLCSTLAIFVNIKWLYAFRSNHIYTILWILNLHFITKWKWLFIELSERGIPVA